MSVLCGNNTERRNLFRFCGKDVPPVKSREDRKKLSIVKWIVFLLAAVLVGGGSIFGLNTYFENKKIHSAAMDELRTTESICGQVQKILQKNVWGDNFADIRLNMIEQAMEIAEFTPNNYMGWQLFRTPSRGNFYNLAYESLKTSEAILVMGSLHEMQVNYTNYAIYRVSSPTSPNLDSAEAKRSALAFRNACFEVSKSLAKNSFAPKRS